ncbi:MAG TPA: hypothetical protein VF796_18695 [Humisphaera sp.]
MTAPPDHVVRFRPSRVDGVADVAEARVYRDRLELDSPAGTAVFPFRSFGLGVEPGTGLVPVGELHFSKACYPDSHFVFYTSPRVTVYMPTDGPTRTPDSAFWRVQAVIRAGGCRLYDGTPDRPPQVLKEPSLAWTAAFVVAALAIGWAIGLSGFLPGHAGEVARGVLLRNPRKPLIGIVFILPTLVVAGALGRRFGRNAEATAATTVVSFGLAVASAWALREVIRPWAPLDGPPYNHPLWSTGTLSMLLLIAGAGAAGGAGWRRQFLIPIARGARADDLTI